MRLGILFALILLGIWIAFFGFVPVQNEVAKSQTTEFSSRARTSVSRPGLTPKTSELQKEIEGRLRWLGLID